MNTEPPVELGRDGIEGKPAVELPLGGGLLQELHEVRVAATELDDRPQDRLNLGGNRLLLVSLAGPEAADGCFG